MTGGVPGPYSGRMVTDVTFRKGHGTGNDFILLTDPDDVLSLTPRLVAALCDRHIGIGADGILRAVRTDEAPGAEWFMDYRNADGSIAEMCGNGARVFARHLIDEGLTAPTSSIATRGGVRDVIVHDSGDVSVSMGPVTPLDHGITVTLGDDTYPAIGALVPNPHAVVFLPTLTGLGDISGATAGPDGAFPDGANIEFVEPLGPNHVVMRVWERGSGETLSCGTGACAVAWAHRLRDDIEEQPVRVDVPGGSLQVTVRSDVTLTGPVEFVARGTIDRDWWESHS